MKRWKRRVEMMPCPHPNLLHRPQKGHLQGHMPWKQAITKCPRAGKRRSFFPHGPWENTHAEQELGAVSVFEAKVNELI